jgi:RNAse (barnase) inhibitor barstar
MLDANVVLAGLTLFEVDLLAVQGKGEFLAALAQVLGAPDWFGHNWDALADVLGDLSWSPSPGYVLVLCSRDAKLSLNDADFEIVMNILADTVSYWKLQGKPFWVFFADGL